MSNNTENTNSIDLSSFCGKRCIVRSGNAGVFVGTVTGMSDDGYTVTMSKVRKIWYWDGAAAVEELALAGPKNGDNCKITVEVDTMVVTDVAQTIPMTDEAGKVYDSIKPWSARN